MTHSPRRVLLLTAMVCLSLASAPTATPWGQTSDAPVTVETLVAHVRQALGRGAVPRARTLAGSTDAPADVRDVAIALVDLFEGKTTDARARLEPLADAGEPDALLELGLLDLREGRRVEGRRLLDRLLQQRSDMTPQNTFRMARAAHALADIRLANTLFQRVGRLPLQQADMETAWGDMLFERHQFTEAARSYRAALEADPTWVRAHIGVSRVLAPEDPPAAAAALERAGTLAPNHPDVWRLRAERALRTEDRAAAAAALDKVAAARPGTYDEIALRAAVLYATREIAEAEALVARAVASNPFFVEGYLSLGGEAAWAYRFEDAAGYARQAVSLDPEHPRAHADLGLYLMRTGDEATARTELERAFRLDPFNTVTFNLLTLLDKIESFVEVESGPFIFKFAKDEAAVLAPYALPLANEAYAVFSERYGFTPQGPILIEMFTQPDDFAVRTMGLPGLQGALGACFGRVIAMKSPITIREKGVAPFSWQGTLWHEIAHVFSLQASDYKVPRWLTEGISVYEEHRYNKAWGRELTVEFARRLATKTTFGVAGLPNAFQRPRDLSLAYFEASVLTEHLVLTHGDAGLRALLAAYAEGAKDEEAFAKAFGQSVDAIEQSFAAFVQTQYGDLARAMAPPASLKDGETPSSIEALTALVEREPDNVLVRTALGRALMDGGQPAEARGHLERAAALAPMARGETSPHALLSTIAAQQGDIPRAMHHLQQLLTWHHDNVDAARRLVVMARGTRDAAAERVALRVIVDVDPFEAEPHATLARMAVAERDFETALIELQAALALGPPNAAEAHADLAEAYLGLGRKDEARRAALKALEYAPTFARAQDLLLAAIGGGE